MQFRIRIPRRILWRGAIWNLDVLAVWLLGLALFVAFIVWLF